MDMYNIVSQRPLLAILRNVPLEKTLDYAKAVVDGGVSFFEVALNSENGLAQISLLRKKYGDTCMIGAGTAITVARCEAAVDAGAQFLLTPGTPIDVLEYCAKHDILLLPGVITPTDVAVCGEYGIKTMKMFPAGAMPRSYIKDLKGPFNDTNYMAIGGVSPDNIREFFDAGYISVGLASSMLPKGAIANDDWERGTQYVKELVARIG